MRWKYRKRGREEEEGETAGMRPEAGDDSSFRQTEMAADRAEEAEDTQTAGAQRRLTT